MRLSFPHAPTGRPYIVGNFVSTLDGVVSFNMPGRSGGRDISGYDKADEYLVGLLRAYADAVVFGSKTVNEGSGNAHVPAFALSHVQEFAALRKKLHKSKEPLNVILTESGRIDLRAKTFHYPGLKTLILTTDAGKLALERRYGKKLSITEVRSLGRSVKPKKVAQVLYRDYGIRMLLHEGGPTVFGAFLKAKLIDELFLTVAPQIAGRSQKKPRLSFAGEAVFSPEAAPWYRLKRVRQVGDHVFLRYARS